MVFNAQGALLVANSVTTASVVQYNSGVVVTLSAASTGPVTVQYTTSDGTAVAGTDYTAQTGTVTFAPLFEANAFAKTAPIAERSLALYARFAAVIPTDT